MWRTAYGVLLVAHGLLTILIWAPSPRPSAPMSTSRSWLLGEARTTSVVLAVAAGVLIALAGLGLLVDHTQWPTVGLVGAIVSIALMVLFFSPWWLVALSISGSLLVVALLNPAQ